KTLASSAADSTARLWDLDAGKEIATLWSGDYRPILAVAASPDGKLVALATEDKAIQIRDTAKGDLIRTFTRTDGTRSSIAFALYSAFLAIVSIDGAIDILDGVTGQEKLKLPGHNGLVSALAFSAKFDTDALLASAGEDGALKLWNVSGRLLTAEWMNRGA